MLGITRDACHGEARPLMRTCSLLWGSFTNTYVIVIVRGTHHYVWCLLLRVIIADMYTLVIVHGARRRETRSQKPDNYEKLQPLSAGVCFIKDRMGYLAYYENVKQEIYGVNASK